jgi:hypothetical protein
LKHGVGDTSQEAIAGALKLALRHMSAHFNAVEVEHIALTHYPWFYLAKVTIHPFRIQESPILAVSDEPERLPTAPKQKRLPVHAAVLYPEFESAVPQLKQMLMECSRPNLER